MSQDPGVIDTVFWAVVSASLGYWLSDAAGPFGQVVGLLLGFALGLVWQRTDLVTNMVVRAYSRLSVMRAGWLFTLGFGAAVLLTTFWLQNPWLTLMLGWIAGEQVVSRREV